MPKIYAKLIMSVSATILIGVGIFTNFIKPEITHYFGLSANSQLIVQLLGVLYFAMGMLNYQVSGNIIGGIYSKPVALANFVHVAIVAITLHKNNIQQHILLVCVFLVYLLFAVLFGCISFTHLKA
jgi:Fe2+ transport system protein B